jgi:hypothetical protein
VAVRLEVDDPERLKALQLLLRVAAASTKEATDREVARRGLDVADAGEAGQRLSASPQGETGDPVAADGSDLAPNPRPAAHQSPIGELIVRPTLG